MDGMEEELTQAKNMGVEASGGILEQVELVNFMCHKYFSMKLGPQINFITGPNGSEDFFFFFFSTSSSLF